MRLRATLRVRLAALYTGLVVLAVAGFGVGVYFLLDAQTHLSFDRELVSDVHHAADALVADIAPDGTFTPDTRFVAHLGHTGGIVEVLDPEGAVLATSDPTTALPFTPADLFAGRSHAHQVFGLSVAGTTDRVVIEPVEASDGTVVGLVSWAKPTDEIESLLRSVALALFVAGSTVCLLAFGAGWLLARRALTPVADLTRTARAVKASGNVGERVPVATADDELGQLAVSFNEMLSTIEENEAGLEQFLADASHELRTPITTVRANLELALRMDIGAEDRRALTEEAKFESDRMARLVTDLLSLTRAELQPDRPEEPVDFAALVDEVVRESLRNPVPPVSIAKLESATVVGSRDRLKELCHILLDNARTYTPEGSVSVELVGGAAPRLTVCDTGVGIPEAERERVFERFYRSATARSLRPAGSGLGLAIARQIAETHRASISVHDTPGGGTTVEVNFGRAGGRPSDLE